MRIAISFLCLSCLSLPVIAQDDLAPDREFQQRLAASRHATEADLEWAMGRATALEASLSAGSDSLLLLTPLSNLGRVNMILGNWGPSIESYDRARAIAERHLDPDDLRLAAPLRDLANVLRIVNAAEPAEQFYARVIELQQRHLGAGDPEFAETLRQRARLWLNLGRLDDAESDAERAVEIAGDDDGSLLLPSCLQARARVHDGRGEFGAALVAYERAEALLRARVPADHVALADLLNDISRHLQLRGDLSRARLLLTEAAEILLSRFPAEHVYNVVVQANLAELNSKEGDFANALRLLAAQLDAMKAAFGPRHPRVAEVLNNMAGNRLLLGEAEEAVRLYLEVLDIYREAYGDDHLVIGQTRGNLATAYQELGRFDDARRELEAATGLLRAAAGEQSFLYLRSLGSLGELELKAERVEPARERLRESAAAMRESLGPDHPLLAETLLHLGHAEDLGGDAQLAREHWTEALRIATAQGQHHPLRAEASLRLAESLLDEDPSGALEHALLAETVSREHLRLLSRGASQNDALRYASQRARGLPIALEIARRHGGAVFVSRAWDALIRSRTLVFDELAERALIARRSDDPTVASKKAALQNARSRLAHLVADPSELLSDAERERLLVEAAAMLESAEEDLAASSARFRRRERVQRAAVGDVEGALPRGSTLVSFVREDGPGTPRYLAFIRDPGSLRLVDLGPAAHVDEAIADWRAEVSSGALPAGPLAQAQESRYREVGARLRALVWEQLTISHDSQRVFLVPDGRLHQLSFAALPTSDGGYLVERFLLHTLGAERDLLASFERGGSGVLALGDADFGLAGSSSGSDANCRGVAGLRFRRLGSSGDEIRGLRELFEQRTNDPFEALVGVEATESNFVRDAASRSVLHVATHGFFLRDDCGPLQSPLLRCGLAFANANQRGDRDATNDGILSGEEILSLELDPVELVVLSACDTGVGDDVEGAGLLGLRRAFRWSGANSLVSSLWAVEDEATRELMLQLYANRLDADGGGSSALRDAQLAVLQRRRAEGLSEHPFTWAAFVTSGAWD